MKKKAGKKVPDGSKLGERCITPTVGFCGTGIGEAGLFAGGMRHQSTEKRHKTKKPLANVSTVGDQEQSCTPAMHNHNKSRGRGGAQKNKSKGKGKEQFETCKNKAAKAMTRVAESWAGGGFQRSPSPRCLPQPTATLIQRACGSSQPKQKCEFTAITATDLGRLCSLSSRKSPAATTLRTG